MSESTYRPQGDGPHSTLAANVLDPGVKADGAMNAGQGVGGAAPPKQKEEGMEHIKKNTEGLSGNTGVSGGQGSATGLGNSASGVSGMGVGRSTYGSNSGVTPGSNPGADDSTGGIAGGAGGQANQGIIGTVKNYLGYGENTGSTDPMEARNVDDYRSGAADSSFSRTGEAAGLGAGTGALAGAGASQYDSSTRDPSYQNSSNMGSTLGDSPATQRESTTVGSAPERETHAGSGAPKPTDSDVTTGAPPTDSADPTTRDTADRSASSGDKGETGDAPKKHVSDKEAATRENRDAIPTAGGEKLGAKHWGESSRVPDVPAKRESEGGISSAEGQGDSTTRDNTAKNTGGASNPHDSSSGAGHDGAEKESFVDKMKDKLHIGGHKS